MVLAFLVASASAWSGEWQNLLDEELSEWNTYLAVPGKHSVLKGLKKDEAGNYLEALGHNVDPLGVFSAEVVDGEVLLHVTGEVYGGIYTKREFENYQLSVQVKWGEKKWPPRLDLELDSGILYHANGEHGIDYWKAWPLSQEFQIIEGGLGDYWTIASSIIDIACIPSAKDQPYIYSKGSQFITLGGEKGVGNHCRRNEDREIKNGAWNTLELIVVGDKSLHIVNGEVVMALQNSRKPLGKSGEKGGEEAPLTKGSILLQSEAGEVWFKAIKIKPLPSLPSKYKSYFSN